MTITRARRFCPYCGQVIDPRATTCVAHRDLARIDPHGVGVDAIPRDPLEYIPLSADEVVEAVQPPEGKAS